MVSFLPLGLGLACSSVLVLWNMRNMNAYCRINIANIFNAILNLDLCEYYHHLNISYSNGPMVGPLSGLADLLWEACRKWVVGHVVDISYTNNASCKGYSDTYCPHLFVDGLNAHSGVKGCFYSLI